MKVRKLAWLAGLLVMAPSSAWAATFTMTCPHGADFTALAAAIDTANANDEDDTIELGQCSFSRSSGVAVTPGTNVLPVLAADSGHRLTFHGEGAWLNISIPGARIAELAPGAHVTFDGVKLAATQYFDSSQNFDGGLLLAQPGSDLTLLGVTMNGGHVRSGAAIASFGTLRVERSAFVGGQAMGAGGALRQIGGSASLVNVTVFSNVSGSHGGAISVEGGASVSLLHITAATNDQTDGPGPGLTVSPDSSVTLTNSIIAGNSNGGYANHVEFFDVEGTIIDGGGNIVGTGATGAREPSTRCGTPESPLDARLQGVDDSRGLRAFPVTMEILANSPAVNAAVSSACAAVDEEGNSRNAKYCDSGAFELSSRLSLAADGSSYHPGDTAHLVALSSIETWLEGTFRLYDDEQPVASAPLETRIIDGAALGDFDHSTFFDLELHTPGSHRLKIVLEIDGILLAVSDPLVVEVLSNDVDGGLEATATASSAVVPPAVVPPAPSTTTSASYDAAGAGCGCGVARGTSSRAGLLVLAALALARRKARDARGPTSRTSAHRDR